MNYVSDCCRAPVTAEGRTTRFWRCTACGQPCDAVHPAPPLTPGSYTGICVAARFQAAAVLAAYTTTLAIQRAATAARTGTIPVGCRNPADVIATAAAVCTFTAILTRASQ